MAYYLQILTVKLPLSVFLPSAAAVFILPTIVVSLMLTIWILPLVTIIVALLLGSALLKLTASRLLIGCVAVVFGVEKIIDCLGRSKLKSSQISPLGVSA